MPDPMLGEIRPFAFGSMPTGWLACNGQLLSIRQYPALYSLLGTTYGGNGTSTFAVPNLQGMSPLQAGQGTGLSSYALGQAGGEATVTLTPGQLPAHSHAATGSSGGGTQASPAGGVWAVPGAGRGVDAYSPAAGTPTPMATGAIGPTGGGQAHNNLMPYLTLNFCIATQGTYPQRP